MTTVCDVRKIDSNLVGLAIAEEVCPGILPTVASDGHDPVWYVQEPNSIKNFGVNLTTQARKFINPSRQHRKGTITGLTSVGEFDADFTQNNATRLLQGFFYADIRQKPATQPYNGTPVVVTSASNTDQSFNAASGLDRFAVGHIVKASGFTNANNNGVLNVLTVAAGKITVSQTLTNEASPPAAAKLEAVGYRFPVGTINLAASASQIVLNNTHTVGFLTLGIIPGEWIVVGGDATANRFGNVANVPGYGRVASVTNAQIVFDDTTFVGATDNGAGKSVEIYFGNVLKNEKDPALIKTRSYQLELTLGKDSAGVQAEYVEGAFADDFTVNIPETGFVNFDLKYAGLNGSTRTGLEGLKTGVRVDALGESAINTGSNVYRQRINVIDPSNVNNTPLFGFLNSFSFKMNNKVAPIKAIGTIGGIDISIGSFEVTGTLNAVFSTVLAIRAIRANADIGLNTIIAANNQGMIFDLPLIGLGGGQPKIAADKPIDLSLTVAASENKFGHTIMYVNFPYLPTAVMPAAS